MDKNTLYDVVKRSYKEVLISLGINIGDVIFMASDVTKTLQFWCKESNVDSHCEVMNALIDACKEVVGKDGTVMFPAYTWRFCKGKTFNRNKSLSQVGALNNWIIKRRSDFKRTWHPLYSFMVYGKYAKDLLEMRNYSSFGMDSPFAFMHKKNAKMIILDVDLNNCYTFAHYVEQCVKIPYRYHKNFTAGYIDLDDNITTEKCSMYVRDLDIISESNMNKETYKNAGILHDIIWEDNMQIMVMDMQKSYDFISNDIMNNMGKNIVKFNNYSFKYGDSQTRVDEF